ncbi:MAG: AMP-binding protein [Bacteroidales bacterium]|nr:AMP-binding protein [Bacteroidales bacterium]
MDNNQCIDELRKPDVTQTSINGITLTALQLACWCMKKHPACRHSEFEHSLCLFLRQWMSDDQHFAIQTSGSTGMSKQLTVSRQAMIASARLTGRFFNLISSETALLCLPLDFIAGKMMLARALVLDLNLVIVEPSSNPLKQVAAGTTIDFAAMTPMQVQECVKDPESRQKLSAIKRLIIGGAPVSQALEQDLQTFINPIYETYGMTETLTHIALRRINGKERSEVFTALPEIHIKTDQRGCLVIHAPHLDEPEIITNDLVEHINPQQFRWLGRADHVINTGGIKVSPEEVEQKLENLISQRFIIIGLPDENFSQKVVLVIEGAPIDDVQALMTQIETRLKPYEKPREIRFMEQFPETSAGKLKRADIQRLLK